MKPLILLADDNPQARRMGAQYLEDLECEVVLAADGAAALAALEGLRERAPELVLVDARLPGVSGIELCRTIKARSARIPVLLMAGALATLTPEELAAADGVLRKPLSSAGLERWLPKTPALSPQELLLLAIEEAAAGGLLRQ